MGKFKKMSSAVCSIPPTGRVAGRRRSASAALAGLPEANRWGGWEGRHPAALPRHGLTGRKRAMQNRTDRQAQQPATPGVFARCQPGCWRLIRDNAAMTHLLPWIPTNAGRGHIAQPSSTQHASSCTTAPAAPEVGVSHVCLLVSQLGLGGARPAAAAAIAAAGAAVKAAGAAAVGAAGASGRAAIRHAHASRHAWAAGVAHGCTHLLRTHRSHHATKGSRHASHAAHAAGGAAGHAAIERTAGAAGAAARGRRGHRPAGTHSREAAGTAGTLPKNARPCTVVFRLPLLNRPAGRLQQEASRSTGGCVREEGNATMPVCAAKQLQAMRQPVHWLASWWQKTLRQPRQTCSNPQHVPRPPAEGAAHRYWPLAPGIP